MKNENQDSMPEQLEEHSLPGTNQAGDDMLNQENRPADEELPEQLEEHSLPGTNQAGKDKKSDD